MKIAVLTLQTLSFVIFLVCMTSKWFSKIVPTSLAWNWWQCTLFLPFQIVNVSARYMEILAWIKYSKTTVMHYKSNCYPLGLLKIIQVSKVVVSFRICTGPPMSFWSRSNSLHKPVDCMTNFLLWLTMLCMYSSHRSTMRTICMVAMKAKTISSGRQTRCSIQMGQPSSSLTQVQMVMK